MLFRKSSSESGAMPALSRGWPIWRNSLKSFSSADKMRFWMKSIVGCNTAAEWVLGRAQAFLARSLHLLGRFYRNCTLRRDRPLLRGHRAYMGRGGPSLGPRPAGKETLSPTRRGTAALPGCSSACGPQHPHMQKRHDLAANIACSRPTHNPCTGVPPPGLPVSPPGKQPA